MVRKRFTGTVHKHLWGGGADAEKGHLKFSTLVRGS